MIAALSLLGACGGIHVDPLVAGHEAVAAGQPEMALAAYRRGCDAGVSEACRIGGALDGVDRASTRPLDESACAAGVASSCLRLAETRGDTWWQAACRHGDPVACLPAARVALVAGDRPTARSLYATRCTALPGDVSCGQVKALDGLADQQQRCAATGAVEACGAVCAAAVPDPGACRIVADAMASSCEEGGPGVDCRRGAEAAVRAGDPPDTINTLLWAGCDRSAPVDAWSCLRLADRVEAGRGALPEGSRGGVAWLRNQACDLQLAYGCAHPDR